MAQSPGDDVVAGIQRALPDHLAEVLELIKEADEGRFNFGGD